MNEFNNGLPAIGDSLSFECSQCGECCTYMGQVHSIVEDRGDFCYLVNNQYSGEKTAVAVDPDKIGLFLDRSIFNQYPEACPFFRYDTLSMKGYCTVHLTRPEICIDFGCWHLLILDSDGKRAGRIMGQRHLASEDEALTRLFEKHINDLAESDDTVWDDTVIRMLVGAGYTVRT